MHGIAARGRDISEARAHAFASVDKIDWPEGFCRRDIGWRAIGPGKGGRRGQRGASPLAFQRCSMRSVTWR